MLLALLDPEGAKRRQGHRLRRRVYQNKVSFFNVHGLYNLIICAILRLHYAFSESRDCAANLEIA